MDHATTCMSIKGWVDWHAPSYFCTKPKIPYQYCPGCKFKEDLQKALKDSLSLVSLVDLKAEHRHTSENLGKKRCFWAITGWLWKEFSLLYFAWSIEFL